MQEETALLQQDKMPGGRPGAESLSLYIHLPWCIRKCPYCDFNSHEATDGRFNEKRYLDALLRDIDFEIPRAGRRPVTSVFLGGGTPSLFSPGGIDSLLGALRSKLALSPGVEISMEANPGTAEASRFRGYRDAGVNRLSIGIQSFDDDKLVRLGRIHGAAEASAAVEMAREAGFEDINLDIMYGLPGQTVDAALMDLEAACRRSPAHISWYQLTLEPNTVFHRYPPPLPGPDAAWEMQDRGEALLAEHGYHRYEVSAYAREDRQCRHNLHYWRFGDYLGIGAGAHGKLSDWSEGRVRRFVRHRIPGSYMAWAGTAKAITGESPLTREELVLEFMMNALRLREGFPAELFTQRTGLSPSAIRPQVNEAVTRGLLHASRGEIRPTQLGYACLNDLLVLFMPAD